jgi:UDP-glucose 4-epimerase
MAKILVIGGSGFLGSHVADMLTKNGHEVFIYDIVLSDYITPLQTMIIGDILDKKMIDVSIQKMDYVYHFAAIADIKEAKEDPIKSATFNIIGTLNILEACRKYSIKRFIFSSSIYVYSNHGSFYRTTKQSCELFVENYLEEFNLNYTILRYGSLYGIRANRFNFIGNVIKQALIDKEIIRKGDGQEVRDYINVIDAAKTSVDVLAQEYVNQHVMITGTQTRKVSEVLEMIGEIFNNEIKITYDNINYEGHYQLTPYSFRPKVALKIVAKNQHDLGQGILDCVYDEYEKLRNSEILEPVSIKNG